MADTIATRDPLDETPSHYREFVAAIKAVDDPNGPDVIATVTCDSVDADKEVVLPEGADLSRFIKAPRIQLCHAYGKPGEYYPLPVGKALWTKRQGRELIQGIRFARSSEMGREVAGLFREDMLNTFSIGFLSLEASPPTKAEKAARPDWRDADLVHRRWKLLEVSVVPIPANEDAIGRWVGKGKRLPSFVWTPSTRTTKGAPLMDIDDSTRDPHAKSKDPVPEPEDDVADVPTADRAPHDFTPGDHVAVHKSMGGGCGHVKAVYGLGETLPDGDGDGDDGTEDMSEGHRPAAKVEMHDADHTGTGEHKCFHHKHLALMGSDAEEKTIATGDRVSLGALAGGGFGRVVSVHNGFVPGIASEHDRTDGSDEPTAKVELIGDDGAPTGEAAVSAKHLTVIKGSFWGYPWDRPTPEEDSYRAMAMDLIRQRHKVMHSGKAGHLYAHEKDMTAHYVRHKDDDDESMGYHSASQVKAMLGKAQGCKSVTVADDHPENDAGYERLHPAPEGYQIRGHQAAIVKAMGEGSGTGGGYTVPPSKQSADDGVISTGPEDKPEDTANQDGGAYVPMAGHVVHWPEHKGMHAGCGKCMSIHKSGKVPAVMNDAMATADEPHARVKLYRKTSDDGHSYEPTDHHVAVKCKMCKRMAMMEVGKSAGVGTDGQAKMAVPYAAGPLSDEAWDAAAAKARVAKWASSDGSGAKDKINWSKYEKAFAICDPEKKEEVGGYSLPHHDVKDGKLVVVKAGVRAALAALGGARGAMSLSEADRAGAETHLKKHEKEWGGGDTDKPGGKSATSPSTPFKPPAFRTRAQVEAAIERKFREALPEASSVEEDRDAVLAQIFGAAL